MDLRFNILVETQPTESTCGPTCLNAIYKHFGSGEALEKTICEIPELAEGGTLGVSLGIHALSRGFQVTIYSHNLSVFDPTWFALSPKQMSLKLKAQGQVVSKPEKVRMASKLYRQFVDQGGRVELRTLSPDSIYEILAKGYPFITGLSSTYLYRSIREYGQESIDDDVQGYPQGHFVVVAGMSNDKTQALICDPLESNPAQLGQIYSVSTIELINSILIGVITYDANIIEITPKQEVPP